MKESGIKLCRGEAANLENLWAKLRSEAERLCVEEPELRHLVDDVVLSRGSFAEALAARRPKPEPRLDGRPAFRGPRRRRFGSRRD